MSAIKSGVWDRASVAVRERVERNGVSEDDVRALMRIVLAGGLVADGAKPRDADAALSAATRVLQEVREIARGRDADSAALDAIEGVRRTIEKAKRQVAKVPRDAPFFARSRVERLLDQVESELTVPGEWGTLENRIVALAAPRLDRALVALAAQIGRRWKSHAERIRIGASIVKTIGGVPMTKDALKKRLSRLPARRK